MEFEQIEKQKTDFTDKYVIVDGARPELARFKDVVGQVKTVNMSGRALVEFLDYHLNIGWYDIDPQFLKVVDKPTPKVAKPEEKKPAAKTESKPAAAAAKTQATKAPAPAGKPSVADILAAARGSKPAAGEAASAAGAVKSKPESTPIPAKPAAAPAKGDRSKMSVADMLAAARSGGAAGAAPAAKTQAQPTPPTAKIDKSKMSIADIIAWCRQHDAK